MASPLDVDSVVALAKPFATSFVFDEKAFRRTFLILQGTPSAYLGIAENSSGIVGYALGFAHDTFFANGPVGWLEELMVAEPFRRQHVGRSLVSAFEAWAVARGCALVALATRRAASFYRSIGYEESATYLRKLL